MATLLDWYRLRFDTGEFRQSMAAALGQVAYIVLAEDPATPNHMLRLMLAHDILQHDVNAYAAQFAGYALADDAFVSAGVAGTLADAEIVGVFMDLFDQFVSLEVPPRPDLSGVDPAVVAYIEALEAVLQPIQPT
jgi:hypothetical protein